MNRQQDYEFTPPQWVDEFLQTRPHDQHSESLPAIFATCDRLFHYIQAVFGKGHEIPQIRVRHKNHVQAETAFTVVNITTGLIDLCLNTKFLPLDSERIPFATGTPELNQLGRHIMMSWIVSHEYYHIVRAHDGVQDDFTDVHTRHALERDADLMATAAIYRLLQRDLKGRMPDPVVRQLAFYLIFFSIRHLPGGAEDGTHPEIGVRLFGIATKICHLQEDNSRPAEAGDEHFEAIIHMVIKCELAYQAENPEVQRNSGIFKLLTDSTNKPWLATIDRWENKVKQEVKKLSQTPT